MALLLIPATAAASTNQPAKAPEVGLLGVVEQAGGGIALLRFGASRPRPLRVGESHRGFRLREVRNDRVVLESPEGETLDLSFPEATPAPEAPRPVRMIPAPPPRSPRPAEAADPPPGPDLPPPGRAAPDDGGGRLFERDEVRLRLQSELPRILANSTVAPRARGRESAGLELIAFPMDTVLGETGLLPGDVLLQINGRDVRGAESLAVLVQRFQTATELELAVDRDGETLLLRYRIE